MNRRREARRELDLPPINVHDFIARDPLLHKLHHDLGGAGFGLDKPIVHPRLTAEGMVSIRLVWREPRSGSSMTYEVTRRLDLVGLRTLMAERATAAEAAR